MKCPVCKTAPMDSVELELELAGMVCPQCRGTFIKFDPYLAWLEKAPGSESDAAGPEGEGEAVAPDSTAAKLCPGCGRFMTRFRIAADLPFHLERCGGCASFWLDGGEWGVLRQRSLHTKLNRITGDPWQHRIREQSQRAEQDQRYRTLLGEEAYARARDFKRWLGTHPQAAIVLAYLQDRELP